MLDSEKKNRNFAYLSSNLHLMGFAWKRDYPVSSKLQTS